MSKGNPRINRKRWLLEAWRRRCAYCGCRLGIVRMTEDHVVPKSQSGNNSVYNILPVCKQCNNAKGDTDPEVWLERCTGFSERLMSALAYMEMGAWHPPMAWTPRSYVGSMSSWLLLQEKK